MYVVTPRYDAAAVVSAVVLRRPTKEYTHRYSMMHRRLTTAGIEVAPQYHQLLVIVLSKQVEKYVVSCEFNIFSIVQRLVKKTAEQFYIVSSYRVHPLAALCVVSCRLHVLIFDLHYCSLKYYLVQCNNSCTVYLLHICGHTPRVSARRGEASPFYPYIHFGPLCS